MVESVSVWRYISITFTYLHFSRPVSQRDTLLCTATDSRDEVTWDFLWSRYLNSQNTN